MMGGRARGTTIVECVVSLLVVAFMLVAGLGAAGSSRKTIAIADRRATAWWMADDMMTAVLAKRYREGSGSATLGVDGGERANFKADFDDVDDFNGWGEQIGTQWAVAVGVVWSNPQAPSNHADRESGLKRVTVTVRWRGGELARLVGMKANVADGGG